MASTTIRLRNDDWQAVLQAVDCHLTTARQYYETDGSATTESWVNQMRRIKADIHRQIKQAGE